jgi:23S rRNA (guanosine2251-2'-O)-methyltransferase
MLIIGRNPVLELLKSGKPVAKVYVRFGLRGDLLQELRRAARERRVPLTVLPKPKFDRIGAGPHAQGIAALVEEIAILELDDMLDAAREQDAPLYIALDSIYDPHNLGAIIRSAECAGAHGAVLPARDASVITDTAVKASAGAVSHLPVARVASMRQALERMKERGLWIAGLDAEGDTDDPLRAGWSS